jgi:hypothetical protein
MKYLKGRERFLSEIKQLNQQQINEAFDMGGQSGPFGNDIAWGDSLVGRLINFAIRKIGVAVNMVRIQPVIARLKMEFRNLLADSSVAGVNEETKKKISIFLIVQQIRVIHFAIVDMKSPGSDEESEELTDISKMPFSDIKSENYLKECEQIVDECVVEMNRAVNDYGKIDNFEELMKIMKELQGMIKIMKTELKETEDRGDKKEESESTSVDNYINNFSAVCGMVLEYDEMKKKQAAEFNSKAGATSSTPTSGQKSGLQVEKEPEKDLVGSATMDSYSYISEAAVNSPIMKPLKSLYDTMKQLSPEDLVKDLTSFMEMSPENKKDVKFSKPISNIYKYIRIKTGVKESIINEDFNAIISRDRLLGDAILALYNVSKTKPDASFEGLTGNMKDNMFGFNSTMPNCLKPEAKKETEQKTESKLLRYQDFKDDYMINESKIGEFLGWGSAKIAQLFGYKEEESKEMKEEEVSKIKVNKNNQQKVLSLYWNEIYGNRITKILLTEKEFEELTKELIELEETPGEGGGIIINGMDPVIGILKCFNRAYKLYTVPVIPGGRSKGAVDRVTASEYTSFGSGSSGGELSAYAGPFRHNKTYNMWENAVTDILGDREFQPIFDKDTKLRVGNKMKEGAGTILRRFMTDIMDGETLYKSKEDFGKGSGGAQKVLLEKYFGEVPDDIKETDLAFSPNEIKENTELQSKIKTASVEFKNAKSGVIDDAKKLRGMIFKLNVEMTKPTDYKEEDKDKNKEIDTNKRYFYIQEAEGDMFYLVFSRRFGNFAKYVANDYMNRETKRTVSFNPSSLMTESQSDLYLTKIKLNDLRKMMTDGSKVKLLGQLQGSTNKIEIGEQKTKSFEILYTSEDDTDKFYNLEKLEFDGTKGFKTSEIKTHAPQTF